MGSAIAKTETKKSKSASPEPQPAVSKEGESGAPAGLPLFLSAQWGAGESLEPAQRGLYEERFGADFSGVRIHTGAQAAQAARAVHASAVTVGRSIAFAPGRYAPGTANGSALLAHELAHVVQQSRGGAAVQGEGFGPEEAEREADGAATAIARGEAVPDLTAVDLVPQLQPDPPAPAVSRNDSHIQIIAVFRTDWIIVDIELDDISKFFFDTDPTLQKNLASDLTAIFNPADGPVPETARFLSGARVKGLIERDLPIWLLGAGLPHLSSLLAARAALIRQQQVRAGLETWLNVAPGTVDWNAQIAMLHAAFQELAGTTTGELSKLDKADMFLLMLQNEVAGQPPIDGATQPPNLATLVFRYATEVAQYDEKMRGVFAEKFLPEYLGAIAALRFIPEGFDLTRFQPSGTDIAEDRRTSLIDDFIVFHGKELTEAYLLDKWTTSGLAPETYLANMNLESEQDGIINHLTDEFMKSASTDPVLGGAIREMAADQGRYDLLSKVVGLGRQLETFNQTLPELADMNESDLDAQQQAIIHDPGTYYETAWYLSHATTNILTQVGEGGNVPLTVLENAQAISGKGDISSAFGKLTFLLELGLAIAELRQAVQQQTDKARQRFADRMRLSWNQIADVIRKLGQTADVFIQETWIPTLLEIAKKRIKQNYEDIRKQLDNFGGATENVIGRYRLTSMHLREILSVVESGQKVTVEGQVFDAKDIPKLKAAAAAMDAKAEKLSTKEAQEDRRAELEKAVDAFEKVIDGIDSGKYKPENFGPEIFQEARKQLKIPEYEDFTTMGMALSRTMTTLENPFQAWAIQRWRYVEKMHESEKELAFFAVVIVLSVATFLLPAVPALFLGALDAGYGVYRGVEGVNQAHATLDLARLDPDLKIQGVSVEDAEKALHDAKIALVTSIVMAGIMVLGIGALAYKGYRAYSLPNLTKLSETEAGLAAKIMQKVGSSRTTESLLAHFGGRGQDLWEALAYTKDAKNLLTLIDRVKDADLVRRLLIAAETESSLTPLLTRFKNFEKLEELLGKATPGQLARIFDLARSEGAVGQVVDALGGGLAQRLLESGLTVRQALRLGEVSGGAGMYLDLVASSDPAIQLSAVRYIRNAVNADTPAAVIQETLTNTRDFAATLKEPAQGDVAGRFGAFNSDVQKLNEARDEMWKLKKANLPTAEAEARVKNAADQVARSRAASPAGPGRIVDLTPEEFAVNEKAQHTLYEQAMAARDRQKALANDILSRLGIKDGSAESMLKRDQFTEFRDGLKKKMIERKNYQRVGQMDDIIRGRFDLASQEDVKRVVAELEKEKPVSVIGPREREGIEGGYPRYHVILKDAETGLTHEWQVGTEATTRVFEGRKGIPEIDLPPGLKLKEGMHANIHDIEYDIFKTIQESAKPEDQLMANELGIPKFRQEVAKLASESGEKGAFAELDARITKLHEEASVILKGIVQRRGVPYVEHMFH